MLFTISENANYDYDLMGVGGGNFLISEQSNVFFKVRQCQVLMLKTHTKKRAAADSNFAIDFP